jgi:DNA-binding winged helix-turn-helix (wHTH) protein
MADPPPARRYRFGVFEADAATGELRRQGIRIKLNAQPFQVLLMLLERPGQLLTREEISRELWPDGTFVDYEHGVNSAVNRIREALGDTAGNPRFVETLARRGYRFVAPVERIVLGEDSSLPAAAPSVAAEQAATPAEPEKKQAWTGRSTLQPAGRPALRFLDARVGESRQRADTGLRGRILASPEELPKASYRVVQTLFVLLQFMYLGFYVGALANLAEIEDLFSPLPKATQALNLLIVTAAILIPVRAFVISAALFHAPGVRKKLLKIWPLLLLLDELWALSPFLLLHHITFGLALACMTLLVYSPFAQRSLVLMGAGVADHGTPPTLR